MRVIHHATFKRDDGHLGGVEKFGNLLRDAIGCELSCRGQFIDDSSALYIVDPAVALDIPAGYNVLFMWHGCASENGFNRRVGYIQEQAIAKHKTAMHVANSNITAKRVLDYYKQYVPQVIHIAVHEDKYWPKIERNDGKFRILTSTAGARHKGRHLLDAIRQNIEDKVQSNYIPQNHVEIIDLSCGLDKEYEQFRKADAFMLCSVHEGFGISFLEAMCANLPILVTNVGLANDLFKTTDYKHNFLLLNEEERDNPEKIAEMLIVLLIGSKFWWPNGEFFVPRKWVLENNTFDMFTERWNDLLEVANEYFGK
jgi:hypothetical protein